MVLIVLIAMNGLDDLRGKDRNNSDTALHACSLLHQDGRSEVPYKLTSISMFLSPRFAKFKDLSLIWSPKNSRLGEVM